MIGVTIGISPVYHSLARLACSCVEEMLDIETLILTESDFLNSGLKHPASLKLKIFDFTREENVFYFDADWYCVGRFNLKKFSNNTSVFACSDFVTDQDWPQQYNNYHFVTNSDNTSSFKAIEKNPKLRKDYIKEIREFSNIKMKSRNWINTGFWIANRKHHSDWLKRSQELYTGRLGHHINYYEQPAMNKALEETHTKVNYLDRKYNPLVATRLLWPSTLLGLHVKIKHHNKFVTEVVNNKITCARSVKKYFFENEQ